MKERRSLYSMIFGNKPKQYGEATQLKLLNGYTPVFTSFGNDAYDMDVVRAAVDAIARNAAKLKAKHVRRIDGKITPQMSNLERMLQQRPNKHMDAYTFLYKVVTMLFMQNNAFIYMDTDVFGNILGFYPILTSNCELLECKGEIFIKFKFLNGNNVTLPYTSIIHLRRHFYKHDIYGESNNVALTPTLELINTTNQGIVNAVKSSATIRGILKFTTAMMKPSDIKAERDRFVNEYLNISNNGGIGAIDSRADYIPVDNKPTTVNSPVMEHIKKSINDYFGVSEAIITSNYTEDQWNAFYESTIEPIAIQLSLEITSKVFSERERGFGNEIIFEANRLQYASNTTKVNLINLMMPLGVLTINEAREVLNLSPVEDGEKRLVSLNFVDADKQNEYQKVGKESESNGN